MKIIFLASLGLNVVLLAIAGLWVVRSGGINYLLSRLGLRQPPAIEARPDLLPRHEAEVVFFGDSISDGPWAEYFSRIKTRARNGDTTAGGLERIEEAVVSKPTQLFVLLGTNDLAQNASVEQIVADYRQVIRKARSASAATKVFVCSVLPVNTRIDDSRVAKRKQQVIPGLNRQLKRLAEEESADFVDLYSHFVDANQDLREDLTYDGLHLNEAGYALYCKVLRPLVDSRDRLLWDSRR